MASTSHGRYEGLSEPAEKEKFARGMKREYESRRREMEAKAAEYRRLHLQLKRYKAAVSEYVQSFSAA